jgi:hypothetical protein
MDKFIAFSMDNGKVINFVCGVLVFSTVGFVVFCFLAGFFALIFSEPERDRLILAACVATIPAIWAAASLEVRQAELREARLSRKAREKVTYN